MLRGVRAPWGFRALGFFVCVLCFAAARTATSKDTASSRPTRGAEFGLLTYNVAGLPSLLSASNPERNMPFISDLLNLYDIALVQEDFVYHDALARGALHPYKSTAVLPGRSMGLGDGLTTFSRVPFSGFSRVAWETCSGRFAAGGDCLTKKGFTFAELALVAGATLHLYNVHMDSGSSSEDVAARAAQAEQLIDAVSERSAGRAVIVAGDTNLSLKEEGILVMLLDRLGLSDACRALSCRSPYLIDRVLYRGTKNLELKALRYELDPRFVRDDGSDLSDHKALGVLFRFRRLDPK